VACRGPAGKPASTLILPYFRDRFYIHFSGPGQGAWQFKAGSPGTCRRTITP
jgi:hypothetical protein